MNETLANLTQNLTLPEINMTAVPSPEAIHDKLDIWGIAVGAVQWALNAIGIPATAEQAGWLVLAIMIFSLYRNLNRIKNMGEDLFKIIIGIGLVLFFIVVVLGVKLW